MRVLNRESLTRLEGLIYRYRLHDGSPPGDVGPILEHFTDSGLYAPLPARVLAITARGRDERRHYIRVALNTMLAEPSKSAVRRYAQAHELAHILLRHSGSSRILWRADQQPSAPERHLESNQERECDQVAAFLLISRRWLHELEGYEQWYIARSLDVPPRLVELRYDMYQKFNR